MIDIRELAVVKGEQTICSVDELQIAAGEHVGVLGPNGSGKSTLLRVLAGLEAGYDGQCNVAAPTAHRIYVHQSPCLFRGTVLFNVAYGLRAHGSSRHTAHESARQGLEKFGLSGFEDRSVRNLSGGEARRVALARAFVVQPRLLLLDEPLADMDDKGATAIRECIRELNDTTVLIASPDPALPEGLVTRTHCLGQSVTE